MIERAFIEQGMKKIQLENYMKKHLERAGFTGLHMVKTPLVTRIVLRVARPGLAIGKGGQNIRMLTEEIGTKFGIDNPQIEIQDIQNPALDSRATVDKMVELIERGFSWKSVVFRTTRDIKEAGAQGVEMLLKGKLSGKGGRKRKHRMIDGYMKKAGDQVKLVDTAKASAYPKAGAIGITLSIIRPEVVFPDKVDIRAIIEKRKNAEKEAVEKAKAAEEKAEAEEEEKKKAEEDKGKEKKPAKKEAAETKHVKKEEEKPVKEKEKPAAKKAKAEEKGKEKHMKKEEKKKDEKKEKETKHVKKKEENGREKKNEDKEKHGKKEESKPAKKEKEGKKEPVKEGKKDSVKEKEGKK